MCWRIVVSPQPVIKRKDKSIKDEDGYLANLSLKRCKPRLCCIQVLFGCYLWRGCHLCISTDFKLRTALIIKYFRFIGSSIVSAGLGGWDSLALEFHPLIEGDPHQVLKLTQLSALWDETHNLVLCVSVNHWYAEILRFFFFLLYARASSFSMERRGTHTLASKSLFL